MISPNQPVISFPKKFALALAVVSGNTYLALFVIEFLSPSTNVWGNNYPHYIIPVASILLSLAWWIISRKRHFTPAAENKIWYTGTVLVRYCIATVLMIYAFAKFTNGQFAQLYSDADTTIAQASGLKLAWAFFGYSSVYSGFLGITQIICALLLFFRRTVLLGAVVLLPVFTNILLIDLTHHINAQDISASLLYMTAFLFLCCYHRLHALFITHSAIPAVDTKAPYAIGGKAKLYMKALVIITCIVYPLYDNIRYMLQDQATPIAGAWTAIHEYTGKDSLPEQVRLDTLHTKLYIESSQYGFVKSVNGRQFYTFETDSAKEMIKMTADDEKIPAVVAHYHLTGNDVLELTGHQGADSIKWIFRRSTSGQRK